MYRFASMLAIALLPVVWLSACGGNSVPELKKVEKKDVIVVARGDKSEILDPHATNSGGDAYLIQQMYDTLVQPSAKPPVRWEPCLAESWKDEDFKVFTFNLRKGVKFHDGADFNAAAAKRSFERGTNLKDPAAPPKLPYAEEYFGDIEKIEAVDDFTLRITLKASNPKFIASCGLFAASIVSPKAIAAMEKEANAGARQNWLTRHPAGTGPYTIAKEGDYQGAETVIMTAFDGYWGGKAATSRVVFNHDKDHKKRREQLTSGAVQLIDSPAPEDWDLLSKDTGVTLYSWEAENLCYLGLNTDAANGFATSKLEVRQAIAYAIDREQMLTLYAGTAKAHHVLLPPVMIGHPAGYRPSTDTGSRAERLEKARALLKGAGVEKLELKLLHPAVSRPYLGKPPEVADFIRQQLAEIGITVKPEPTPMRELGDIISKGTAPMVLIGWMGETGEPDNFWTPLLSGRGKPSDNNVPRFWDKDVAAKVDAAAVERDIAKREAMYLELEKTVHEKFRPMVPLLTAKQAVAWRSEVEGIYVDSTGMYRLHKAHYKE
jgi:peptide/nickel transport system substrate-binding protein